MSGKTAQASGKSAPVNKAPQMARATLEKNFFWHGVLTINEFNSTCMFNF